MNPRLASALLVSALLVLVAARPAAAATCEELTGLSLPNTTITSARVVTDAPASCRVAATLKPTPESDIKIEVWMPVSGWNGKFQAVGNGGWAGSVDTNAIAAAVRRGYAAASTDGGHAGGGGPWMANREKVIDYGHRAVHEMTLVSKQLVGRFYGSAPRYSYFVGCSAGGRQALKAAQTYPADFDGIVAGAPALNATGRAAFAVYAAQQLHKDEASYIPQTKYAAIHEAVLQACDAKDGVTDRVLENPRACTFDPQVIACKAGEDTASCLTPAQVTSARALYQPLVNPRTKAIVNTPLEFGSEIGWSTFGGAQPFAIATQLFQFMLANGAAWDYKTFDVDRDMTKLAAIEGGVIDAKSTDLKAFLARGGKLIQYHGWTDPQIPSGSSPAYYEAVTKAQGATVRDGYRLFMVPGMNHCGGGDGTASFDMLAALENWVEKQQVPNSIPASKVVDGQAVRTRPLCPYPQTASYKGSGSTDDAASFSCR